MMRRDIFIRRLMRYALLLIMAVLVMILGRKVVIGQDCSACPGKGICNGKTDCNKY
jgi:vancomycin permeability regulator SanA